jgi:hypothetical protein
MTKAETLAIGEIHSREEHRYYGMAKFYHAFLKLIPFSQMYSSKAPLGLSNYFFLLVLKQVDASLKETLLTTGRKCVM